MYRSELRFKVARGGSFSDLPENCRLACRGRLEVFGLRYVVGLRPLISRNPEGIQYPPLALFPVTIATDAEAPIRVAPASIIACAVFASRTPPDALTPK